MDFQTFFTLLILGVTTGAIYAISATGLVVTYITSGVFNFAHGAMGMFLAFVYWELRINQGWGTIPALLITLLVVAPIMGALLDVLVMRRLVASASVATKLVVTLALLLAFQGAALTIWGIELRALPGLWGSRSYTVGDLVITWDQTTTVIIAVAVAFGLRLLFRRTRLGVAMRAVVDSPELCSVKGLNPRAVTTVSWMLGTSLAGLAAILIAPGLNMEVNALSLLVVSAYAAAVVGRLQNLPATFAGALALGLAQTMFVGYLPQTNFLVRSLKPAMPFFFLFAALLLFREKRLPEKIASFTEPRPPSARFTWILGGVLVLAAIPLSGALNSFQLIVGSKGLAFACVTISLAMLTGLSGQVSLMQMSFAGIGAVVLGRAADIPWPVGLVLAGLVTGLVGVVVALPALRLRGIYLALSTLACAILMDELVFGNSDVLGGGTTLAVERPSILGFDFDSEQAMFVLLALAVVVFANVFLAVRRSRFGRLLTAMRDSPTATQMVGISVTRAKLQIFALSAMFAGLAGAMLGSLQVRVGQLDFLWFRSLTVLLVAIIFGISSVSGALLGAMLFVVLPEVLRETAGESGNADAFFPLIIGLLAIVTARRQEGLAGQLRAKLRPWLQRVPWLGSDSGTRSPPQPLGRDDGDRDVTLVHEEVPARV